MLKLITAAAFIVTLLSPLVATGPSSAKDLGGRVAIGAQIEPLVLFAGDGDIVPGGIFVPGGLSVKAWFGNVGVQGILGFMVVSPDEGESSAVAAGALRVLFNVARAEDTNLFVGAGLRLLASESDDDPIAFDLFLGVEHFLGEHFSVAGQVGLSYTAFRSGSITRLGDATSWGTAFHFYF